MQENKIICGAMPEATKVFPDGYFNCCISSPPYWALRAYGTNHQIWDGDKNCKHKWGKSIIRKKSGGTEKTDVGNFKDDRIHYVSKTNFCNICGAWRGELGLEPTFELYIKHLCDIYDEVKRVLRDDGTCWVNLGDTYNAAGMGSYGKGAFVRPSRNEAVKVGKKESKSIPTKSLCLIPQRFAIEMVNRGWILRNVIIWHKPNPMPSSAKDRFTVDFEYVYFFVKSKKYWFEPQYEPHKEPWRGQGEKECNDFAYGEDRNSKEFTRQYNPLGRNKRTVWTIPTQAYSEAHFATFPEKLVQPMIKAGCPEFVCTKCGKAREKIWEPSKEYAKYLNTGKPTKKDVGDKYVYMKSTPAMLPDYKIIGYTDCGCNADWRPGRILDCFCRKLHHRQGSRQAA